MVGGNASPSDPRFPYISDVIRAGNRRASYEPVRAALAPGTDPQIKAIQDKLVALGYLDRRFADGLVGRSHSATLDAVREFQRRNGSPVDRDLGGPNSLTRKRLQQPIKTLAIAV